jgi:hypothetical protein
LLILVEYARSSSEVDVTVLQSVKIWEKLGKIK